MTEKPMFKTNFLQSPRAQSSRWREPRVVSLSPLPAPRQGTGPPLVHHSLEGTRNHPQPPNALLGKWVARGQLVLVLKIIYANESWDLVILVNLFYLALGLSVCSLGIFLNK